MQSKVSRHTNRSAIYSSLRNSVHERRKEYSRRKSDRKRKGLLFVSLFAALLTASGFLILGLLAAVLVG